MEKHTNSEYKHRLLTVYGMLVFGIILTTVSTILMCQMTFLTSIIEKHFTTATFTTILLMILVTSLFNRTSFEEQKVRKMVYYALNCMLLGVPLLCVTAGTLIKSMIYAVILSAVFSVKALFVPESVVELCLQPLTALHPLVIVCSVYSILFSSLQSWVSVAIMTINLHGGFLVYSGLLICNTQRLRSNAKYSKFDPLFSSFVIFMNIMSIYYRISVFLYETPVLPNLKCCESN